MPASQLVAHTENKTVKLHPMEPEMTAMYAYRFQNVRTVVTVLTMNLLAQSG